MILKRSVWSYALLLSSSWIGTSSFAYETESDWGYLDADPASETVVLEKHRPHSTDPSRLVRFDQALDLLGIPEEAEPDFSQHVRAQETNSSEVEKMLPFIDPDRGLSRYLSMDSGLFQLFRDFFKPAFPFNLIEFEQTLSTELSSSDSMELISRLKLVSTQVKAGETQPLKGLRVLIDPGHMGGDDWDRITGKYVSVNGRKVSEGTIALWTSLLTAQKLENLGATILMTRTALGPVSTEDPAHFNITPYLNHYFHNSLDDWMAPFLTQTEDQMRKTLPLAPQVTKAYSQTQRMQFFIFGSDLEARAKMIDAFQPDIVIDVHFDASKNDQLQNRAQSLEAFVPGAFRANETGSRKSKALAIKHLLEVRRWNQSVELADHVTASMSEALKIPRLSIPQAFSGIRVRDGVYTRNLYINRRTLSSLVMYLECLHYDHVNEHTRLSILDKKGNYRGSEFNYPGRLDTISQSISDGIIRYFDRSF